MAEPKLTPTSSTSANGHLHHTSRKASKFPVGGGEMGRLIREFNWTKTPLGPVEAWPQSLRTAIDIVLQSPLPLVMLWGTDGIMIYNDAYSVFAGARHPFLLGSKVVEGWPEVADFNRNVMKQGLKGKTLSYKDHPLTLYRHGNAEEVWMDLNYSPLLDESGKPVGVLAIVVETTAQVITHRQAEDSENRFRFMAEAIPQKLFTVNALGEIDYVNPQWSDYTGTQFDPTKYWSWLQFVHPDDLTKARDAWHHAFTSGEPLQLEVRLRKADGQYRWHLSRALAMYDTAGNLYKWFGSSTDIDDQKKAEQQLQESQRNLRFLAEASSTLSSSLDLNTVLNMVAKQAIEKIADWCAIDLVNKNGFFELAAVAHRDPKLVRWVRAYREANPVRLSDKTTSAEIVRTQKPIIIPHVTEDMLVAAARSPQELKAVKRLQILSFMSVPLIARGKSIGVLTLVSSQMDEQYNDTDLEFAQDLASRAAMAIDNARLYSDMQQAVKARNDFIGIATHELRTPVTSVKAYGQALQSRLRKQGDIQSAERLAKMDAQLDRLTSLISDLLDVTRIESGRLQLNITHFDLDKLVQDTFEEMQLTTDKHKISVHGATHKQVKGDRERVGQVLTNFLSNAIKYSPQADTINIHLSVVGKNARVAVEDFGVGIPADKKDRVFERFFRVSGPKQDTFPGLGLGLYISSEIISRLGGKIWVESESDKGSTFGFDLPIAKPTKKF